MTKSNATRRALLVSALSIVMCLAMLIGTTFAWFTDTASTAVNKIQAGNLDVKLMYSKDMVTWNEATTETPLFDDNALWEPGHTEIVYLKVVNAGTMALKYETKVNNFSEKAGENSVGKTYRERKYNISKFLKIGTCETSSKFASRDEALTAISASEKALTAHMSISNGMTTVSAGQESNVFAVVIYMPTNVGNEANPKDKSFSSRALIYGIGLEVTASQAVGEEDSFGPDYDKNAPDVVGDISRNSNTNITENIQGSGKFGTVALSGGAQATINADVYSEYVKYTEGTKDVDAAVAVWASDARTKVVINKGTFMQVDVPADHSNQLELVYAETGAQIEITGGTFKSATPEWTLNCADGSASKIIVSGGSFYKFNPADNSVGEGEIVIHDGFHVVQNGDWFTVVED